MGGDHGPAAVVAGARLAVERGDVRAEDVVLVGPAARVDAALAERAADRKGDDPLAAARRHDAPDELSGRETPVEAMRRLPRNSVAEGIGLVKAGQADAFVSAGNTGLVVASATLGLRCLEGIRRPGIAVTINGERGPFTLIDVGANPQPKAIDMLHYAVMGSAYVHDALGVQEPRVGLMNIGSEDKKGNPLVREARELLRNARSNFRFVGNIEGVDVFSGVCDVIVSDGFTGNVLLKVSEGCAEYMLRAMARLMGEVGIEQQQLGRVVGRMKQDVDYSEYGGALLLGVEGIVTICHGRSEAPAFANAIRFAARAVGARVNSHIVRFARQLESAGATEGKTPGVQTDPA